MRVSDPYRINTLPPRRSRPDTRAAKMVFQCEFGVTSAAEETKLIKTGVFNTCVVAAFFSSSCLVAGLAHFDVRTEVGRSFREVIMSEFSKRRCGEFRVRLLGGLARSSEGLVHKIRDALKGRRIRIDGVDLYNPKGYAGLLLDAESGELFDVQSPLLPFDTEEIRRNEEAQLYLAANPEQRMIRLVGEKANGS
jgi:hypothetical protein